jgi:hypothetical protein
MRKALLIALLILVGVYTEAQLVDAKLALREIATALQSSSRVVILRMAPVKRPATIPVGYDEE